MPDFAYLNHLGKIVPPAKLKISVLDRGFLFADSVYEVVWVYAGKSFRFEDHLARLQQSLSAVVIPFSDFDEIIQVAQELILRCDYAHAKLYIQVTRGIAPRAHAFPKNCRPTLFMMIEEGQPIPPERRRAGITAITTIDPRWARCDIKSTALLPNVLWNQKAKKNGAYETIFISPANLVREGTHNNIFLIKDHCLITPALDGSILAGITRNEVLKLTRAAVIPTVEREVTLRELYDAEEVFVSGTTTEILGVVRIDEKIIGAGKVGAITWQLTKAFWRLTGQEF